MTTTTTAPGIHYRKTKAGTWVAFGPAASITAGTSITVTTRSGEVKTEHIESIGRPFDVDGIEMVYGYLAARATATPQIDGAENTTGGLCAQCGAVRLSGLTLCRDSSGISDYCCSRCASGPDLERSFC